MRSKHSDSWRRDLLPALLLLAAMLLILMAPAEAVEVLR